MKRIPYLTKLVIAASGTLLALRVVAVPALLAEPPHAAVLHAKRSATSADLVDTGLRIAGAAFPAHGALPAMTFRGPSVVQLDDGRPARMPARSASSAARFDLPASRVGWPASGVAALAQRLRRDGLPLLSISQPGGSHVSIGLSPRGAPGVYFRVPINVLPVASVSSRSNLSSVGGLFKSD